MSSTPCNNKRKLNNDENCVPKLIDDKRKHLEKRLCQSKRDEILLKEAKEDGLFRKELCQAIKESNKMFADAMSNMSDSFKLMAESMKISLQQMNPPPQQIPAMSYNHPQGTFHQYQPSSAHFYPVNSQYASSQQQQQQSENSKNDTYYSMLQN